MPSSSPSQRAPGALTAAGAFTEGLASGPIRVRVGVHTGTPLLTDEGYVGADVNRAARIAAAGHGGQVLVSSSTASLVGLELTDLGEHRLKDLSAPERISQLGEGAFPPLKSLYRTNLPVPATPFLGRKAELAEVVELLTKDGVRLLTLTGPGGTGKTRLALQAAAEASEFFPDGVFWVPLAPLRDPELVLPSLARALAVSEEPGRALEDTLSEHLSGKSLLVLLDNVEHLLPPAAERVAALRASNGSCVLVTRRERLRVSGEQTWLVPPLVEDDGTALFVARARAIDPRFAPSQAVDELCARLDELPLAIELAAARAAVFSAEQLLERLSGRLDLLRGDRDTDPRQQTLRATIEWSHDLLDEVEQQLFARLAVFVGGCTYEAAEEVAGADPNTLQSLLDKSLLRKRDADGRPRYWMLETIREYAAERLEESGEAQELWRRHAAWLLAEAQSLPRDVSVAARVARPHGDRTRQRPGCARPPHRCRRCTERTLACRCHVAPLGSSRIPHRRHEPTRPGTCGRHFAYRCSCVRIDGCSLLCRRRQGVRAGPPVRRRSTCPVHQAGR
jgi:predicted ATPase